MKNSNWIDTDWIYDRVPFAGANRPEKRGRRYRLEAATQTTKSPGSRVRRGPVRDRILDAVTSLIQSQGVESLTTVSIAKAAKIRQPNFYAHFRNIDDCLKQAAERIVGEYSTFDHESFRELQSAIESGQIYGEMNLRYHRRLIEVLLDHRQVVELFLRHRHGTSAFALVMRRYDEQQVAFVRDALWGWAAQAGIDSKHHIEIAMLAETLHHSTGALVLSLIDGRVSDPDAAARVLASNADASIRATFRRLLTA